MTIKHFIYDFDGTLSDSYPVFMQIDRDIIQKHNGKMICTEQELYRAIKDRTYKAHGLVEWQDGLTKEAFMDEFQELQGVYAREFRLFDGAKEILRAVVESGKKNYLYTHSGAVVHEIMEHMGISQYFTHVLDASQGFPSKPAPDALNSLIERFDLEPQECVMIGDRPIDTAAGENAGMHSCLFDTDGFYPDTPSTYRIDTLFDLKKLI